MIAPLPELTQKGLSIERLHAFCKVAEKGGYKEAAPHSESQQAQFCKQVNQLSDYFGVTLTRRQGKKIALTSAGVELARLCREHFIALNDFEGRCKKTPPVIAVGSGDSLLQWLVLPRLAKIQNDWANHPRIEISNLRTENIVKRIKDFLLDFGLIRKIDVPWQCKSEVIGTYSYSIWMPKTLAPPTGPTRLNNFLKTLSFAVVKTQWGTAFDDLALLAGIKIRVGVLCDSFPQALQTLTAGNYAVVLPNIVKPFIDETRFVQVQPKFLKAIKDEVCLAWNPRLIKVKTCGEKAVKILSEELKFSSS